MKNKIIDQKILELELAISLSSNFSKKEIKVLEKALKKLIISLDTK